VENPEETALLLLAIGAFLIEIREEVFSKVSISSASFKVPFLYP
jgi:hypothetical protein